MTRIVPLLALGLGLVSLPTRAHAQLTSGDITVTLFQVAEGGTVTRTSDIDLGKALNGAQCADASNVELSFSTANFPSSVLFADLWVGTPSEDCSTTAARAPGDTRTCTHLTPDPTVDATDGSFSVSLADLVTGSGACDGTAEVSFNLWVLATGESETTGEITTSQFGYVSFSVDPAAPEAPVPNETSASGDSGISLSWPAVGETDVTYRAYVDVAAGSCEATTLIAGGAAPVDDPGIPWRSTSQDARSISLDASGLGLADGQSAAVALTAIDANDNESVLSEIVCITRVPTAGFCDVYAADTGESCPSGCSVSRAVGSDESAWPTATALGLLALAIWHRRRS